MCVSPISVRNKKLHYDPLTDRLYNFVPCGKCYECQEAIKNGYETRLLYEYLYTRSIGGMSFYFTLTYNNANLPVIPNTNVSVCSKYDVQCFLKRLRHKLNNFKYFISSEYGHLHFRPHYHGILFLPVKFNHKFIQDTITKTWNKGIVNFGLNNGVISDTRPFGYVSKYVTKDLNFNNYLFKQDSLQMFIKEYMEDKSKYPKISLFPFHLQSIGLGLSIVNMLKFNDYVRGYFVRNDIVGLNRKMYIPLYIMRYKLYDKYTNDNGNISYKLNDYGKQVLIRKMYLQYYKLLESYEDILNVSLDKNTFINCSYLNSLFNYENWCKVVDDLKQTGLAFLVAYQLLYHDIKDVPFEFQSFHYDLNIYIECVLKNDWFNFCTSEKYVVPFEDECKMLLRIFSEIKSFHRYKMYCNNIDNYNRNQFFKSLRTKEKKLKYKCNYNEFINMSNKFKKYRVCLSTQENNLTKLLNHLEVLALKSLEIA